MPVMFQSLWMNRTSACSQHWDKKWMKIYHEIWVFTIKTDILCLIIISKAVYCTSKSLKIWLNISINLKTIFPNQYQGHSDDFTVYLRGKYWTRACFTISINYLLHIFMVLLFWLKCFTCPNFNRYFHSTAVEIPVKFGTNYTPQIPIWGQFSIMAFGVIPKGSGQFQDVSFLCQYHPLILSLSRHTSLVTSWWFIYTNIIPSHLHQVVELWWCSSHYKQVSHVVIMTRWLRIKFE